MFSSCSVCRNLRGTFELYSCYSSTSQLNNRRNSTARLHVYTPMRFEGNRLHSDFLQSRSLSRPARLVGTMIIDLTIALSLAVVCFSSLPYAILAQSVIAGWTLAQNPDNVRAKLFTRAEESPGVALPAIFGRTADDREFSRCRDALDVDTDHRKTDLCTWLVRRSLPSRTWLSSVIGNVPLETRWNLISSRSVWHKTNTNVYDEIITRSTTDECRVSLDHTLGCSSLRIGRDR